jgi:hypothetical protein
MIVCDSSIAILIVYVFIQVVFIILSSITAKTVS